MKKLLLTFVFILITFFSSLFKLQAQDRPQTLMVMNMNKDQVFQHLKRFAIDNYYFVQQMDKATGYMQWKIILKGKGLLSSDNRYTINVFVDSVANLENQVDFQINRELILAKFSSDLATVTYEDHGFEKTDAVFNNLIAMLKKYFDQIVE